MRVVIPQITWHTREPVLTLDFDPTGKSEQGFYRLVTGGGDKLLLVWHLTHPETVKPEIVCVSELTRHQKGVNVCRFSPCGRYIASGDDDSYVFIWKNESIGDREEVWSVDKIFRRHVEDVSDLSWSSDGNFLISGSVDNTAVLWDVKKGKILHFWSERQHTGFVQGVACDPLGELSATVCIDRNLRFFDNKTGKLVQKALKYPPAWLGATEDGGANESKENKPLSSQSSDEGSQEKLESPMEPTASTPGENTTSEENVRPPAPEGEESSPAKSNLESGAGATDQPLLEVNKGPNDTKPSQPKNKPMTTLNRLFHDDSLKTFCRRLCYSPRGELLVVPGGLLPPTEKIKREPAKPATTVDGEVQDENSKDSEKVSKKSDTVEQTNNAAIVFCRNSWTNPCAVIPTGVSYSIAARFNPVYFGRERKSFEYGADFRNSNNRHERVMSCVGKLRAPRNDQKGLLDMPYRLVYALATNDSLLIGDTMSTEPLTCIQNIHCTRLTDISWSSDGLLLMASSTDGYCSIISFEKGELGNPYIIEGDFPSLTPTCFPIAPPSPKPVHKKEPKEPKIKEPKEKKEPKPKEKKDKKDSKAAEKKEKKAPKEKKEKTLKGSAENPDEKKKKLLTIKQMLATTPKTNANSPSSSARASESQKDASQLAQVTPPPPAASMASVGTGIPLPITAAAKPKPTFLDSWVKKTPKSANTEEKKELRKSPQELDGGSKESSSTKTIAATPTNGDNRTPPSSQTLKQPRRVQLITIKDDKTIDGKKEKSPQGVVGVGSGSKEGLSTQETVAPSSSNVTLPSNQALKQPRRIQLITITDDDEGPAAKKANTTGNI